MARQRTLTNFLTTIKVQNNYGWNRQNLHVGLHVFPPFWLY